VRDYLRIATKIRETPWLMTPEALSVICAIMDERINNGKLSDDELAIRLRGVEMRAPDENEHRIKRIGSTSVVSLQGPLFGKANMLTEMSGATSLEMFASDLKTALNDDSVSSVIIDIDSPGGTSEMVKEVGQVVMEGREQKPIYAFANSMAGSAAYWIGSQATEMFANHSGLVGSVGAYTVHEDYSVADAQQGHKFTFISAGKYKTEGNEHEPLSAEGNAYRQEVIDDLYQDFVNHVAAGRGVSTDEVEANYGQGRVVPSTKALENGMIDGISTLSQLVNHASVNQLRPGITIVNNTSTASTAVVGERGPELILPNTGYFTFANGTLNLESKEYEHSEPGTGSPPAPRTDEDGSDDIAIRQGWRRDDLPVYGPNAPTPNPPPPVSTQARREGNSLTPEQLESIRISLGCSEEDFYDSLRTAVDDHRNIRSSMELASEDERLKKEFPQMWDQHQHLLREARENRANSFVETVKMFSAMSGDQLKPTNQGMSSLAMESVKQMHLAFADGTASVEDFERCIHTVTQGGLVEYGERGSSRAPSELNGDYNLNLGTTEGISNTRKMFAARVKEIQMQDNLDFKAALNVAAQKYPDLYKAYVNAVPVNTNTPSA